MCVFCQPVVWHFQNCLYMIIELKAQLSEYEIKIIHLDNIDKYQDVVTLNVSINEIIAYENEASLLI